MKLYELIVLALMFSLLLLPSALATLTVQAPERDYLKVGEDYVLRVQVYNGSGQSLTSGEVNCSVHVYDGLGGNSLKAEMAGDDREWSYTIPGNIIYRGDVPYVVWCENATRGYGGTLSDSFKGTPTGANEVSGQGGLATIIYVLVMALLFFGMAVIPYPLSQSKITDLILRRSGLAIGTYMMFFNSTLVASLAVQSGLVIEREIFTYTYIVGVFAYLAAAYLVLRTIIDVAQMYQENKHKEMVYGKPESSDPRI